MIFGGLLPDLSRKSPTQGACSVSPAFVTPSPAPAPTEEEEPAVGTENIKGQELKGQQLVNALGALVLAARNHAPLPSRLGGGIHKNEGSLRTTPRSAQPVNQN